MKKKIAASSMLILLLVGIFGINLKITPVAFGTQSESSSRKEVWKLVNVTNPGPTNKSTNIVITVGPSREGVNIACSTDITEYFRNPEAGYTDWLDWLNGTTRSPYHWGEMDWCVSAGSLAEITYDEIQQWWDMYSDSGAGVAYETFMGNTYMADWNSTVTHNDPDIIYPPIAWEGNQMVIKYLPVFNGTTINIAFKIVITEPGAYTFNVTSTTAGLEVLDGTVDGPASWRVGGVATLVVGPLLTDEYPTIQAAINAANPGYTILVYDGTYLEALYINKSLTLKSASTPVINGSQSVTTNYGPRDAVIFVENAINVTLEGLAIQGYGLGTVNPKNYGVIYENSSGTITNCTVSPNTIGDLQSTGIGAWDNSSLTVDSSTIENFGRIGVFYFSGCAGVVYNSTIIGQVYGGEGYVNYGIEVEAYNFACNIEIIGNRIYNCGNTFSPEPTWSSAGIVVDGWLGQFYTPSSTVVIEENDIHDNYFGIEVVANSLSHAHYNNIYNNTVYGVISDSDYGDNNATFNARFNWWGNETGPHHSTNPGGQGDDVSDYVDFEPWLVKAYAPGQLVPVSVIYVDPQYINRTSPALNTTFTVDVNIANVSMLYGFQFRLEWNSSLLNLTDYDVKIPPQWTMDYNVTIIAPGNFSLAVTALSPSPPFTGSTTLASLTFEIVYDPIYPENVGCSLALENVTIVDPDVKPIVRLVYSGNYSCYSTKTKLVLMPQDLMAYMVPTEFDVDINVTNVVDLYAFEFELTYNTTLLELIVEEGVDITIPCTFAKWNVTEDDSSGHVLVRVEDISPSARNGTRTLATIPFKVIGFVWNTTRTSANCTLAFSSHELNSTSLEEIQHDVVNGTYRYTPIQGDLNMDGTVNIFDIILAAIAFGSEPGDPNWNPRADLNCDGNVDIFDIILIAVNFGREEP